MAWRGDAVLKLAVCNAFVASAPGQDTNFFARKADVVLSNKLMAEHAWQGVIPGCM